jgi:muramidase (phage lysozyme)
MATVENHTNLSAFLDMLGFSEGTDAVAGSDHGYNVVVGGQLFSGYADHPRRKVWLPRYKVYSTAAGRYQFLVATWDALRKKLSLPDFSPQSQDLACIELIKEKSALDDISSGRIADAITKCAPLWASLPGAGYGQREVSRQKLINFYTSAGGKLA